MLRWCHAFFGLVEPRSCGRRAHVSGVGLSLEQARLVEAASSHLRLAGESGSGPEGHGRGSAKASFLISHNNNGSLKVPFQMESFLLSDPSVVCWRDQGPDEGAGRGTLLVFSDGSQALPWPSGCALATHTCSWGNAKEPFRNCTVSRCCSSGPHDLCKVGKNGMNFNAGGHN